MKLPPIHELKERLKRRPTRTIERQEPAKPPTQEFERPENLTDPNLGPSRGNKHVPKIDETQPIPIYGGGSHSVGCRGVSTLTVFSSFPA